METDRPLTRLLLVDDHPVVRRALVELLSIEADFEVVGETGDPEEALALCSSSRPDVVLMDLVLPPLGGLEVTRRIRTTQPETRVLVLSVHSGEAYVARALQSGAGGYVPKSATADELVGAIRTVAAGKRFLSSLLPDVVHSWSQAPASPKVDPYELLTSREKELLQPAAEGLSNGEIAEQFGISPRTVEIHRAHIMRKLRLTCQTDLVRWAIGRGLVAPLA